MLRIVAILLVLAVSPLAAQQRAATTVILVRHAEKATLPAEDPALTAEGAGKGASADGDRAGRGSDGDHNDSVRTHA